MENTLLLRPRHPGFLIIECLAKDAANRLIRTGTECLLHPPARFVVCLDGCRESRREVVHQL